MTLLGASLGIHGLLGEKVEDYNDRAKLYYFSFDIYTRLIISKYTNQSTFALIAVGTVIQIISTKMNLIKTYNITGIGYLIAILLVIILYIGISKIISRYSWSLVRTYKLKEYYEMILNINMNEANTNKKWKYLYAMMSNGKKYESGVTDIDKLQNKIEKHIQKKGIEIYREIEENTLQENV